MQQTALLTGLAFAARGHAALPLWWPVRRNGHRICACPKGAGCPSPAKHPIPQINPPHGPKLVPNGLLSASTVSGILKHWWSLAPEANLGVRTDRLIVLDIDERKDGAESLAALEQENGPLPPPWKSRTGGGGEHLIFICPEGITVSSSNAHTNPKLGPGVDIRSNGGYIVAPPSIHISGRAYAWDVDRNPAGIPLALPPEWLLTRLAEPRSSVGLSTGRPVPPEEWARFVGPVVTQYADMAAARIYGHLLRHYIEPRLAHGLLCAWNRTFCQPPLSDSELRRIIDRIADKEADRRNRLELRP